MEPSAGFPGGTRWREPLLPRPEPRAFQGSPRGTKRPALIRHVRSLYSPSCRRPVARVLQHSPCVRVFLALYRTLASFLFAYMADMVFWHHNVRVEKAEERPRLVRRGRVREIRRSFSAGRNSSRVSIRWRRTHDVEVARARVRMSK